MSVDRRKFITRYLPAAAFTFTASACQPVGRFLENVGKGLQGNEVPPLGTQRPPGIPEDPGKDSVEGNEAVINKTATITPENTATIKPTRPPTITSTATETLVPTPNRMAIEENHKKELERIKDLGIEDPITLDKVWTGKFLRIETSLLPSFKKTFTYLLLTDENGVPYAKVEGADCYYNYLLEAERNQTALGNSDEEAGFPQDWQFIPVNEPYSKLESLTLKRSTTVIDRLDDLGQLFDTSVNLAELPSFELQSLEYRQEENSGITFLNCR